MYVFKSSFLKAKKTSDGYQNINISNVLMSSLLEDYGDGYITLTHTQLKGTFYLTIVALRESKLPLITTQTFNQWLTHNHDKQLPTLSVMPKYTQGVVRYGDAFISGFKVDQIARYMSVKDNTSKSDKIDLLIKKGLPDKNALYKRVLVSVNGFMHRTFAHEDGVAVAGGGDTFNNTGINTVGIFSFYKVCDLYQYKIEESMITPTSSTTPLYHEMLINLGMPLVDKSVIMSIGGHLIIDSGLVEIVNAEVGIIMVKFKKLDIVKMILNSVDTITLDSLGVFQPTRNVTYNKVKPIDLISDLIIKKYMQLEQSFVVVADCDSLQVEYSDVSVTGLPGVYETLEEPIYPMVNSQNLVYEYLKHNLADTWSIRLHDDITKRYMYKTNIDIDNEMINASSPTHKWFYDSPRLMKITGIHKP